MTPHNSYEFYQMRHAEQMAERDEIRRANMIRNSTRLAGATARATQRTARRVRATLAFAFGPHS